jgi:basic membrane protein A
MRMAAVALTAALAVAACGGSSGGPSSSGSTSPAGTSAAGSTSSTPNHSDIKVGLVFDIGGKGDKSFNDSADAGITKATKDFGITMKELEPNSGGTNREELLTLLASQGYNPVIAVGFSFDASVKKIAAKYPNTNFAIIDDVIDLPNVASLVFAAEQSSFLVGAVAALKSKSHHVGFIGGVNVPLLQTFQAGFDAGAKHVDPSIKIDDKYLTNPPDFSGFTSPDKGKEAALGMYNGGADVVYAAAGGSGTGVFDAANSTHNLAIGVDSDQYLSADPSVKHVIISSALKRVDVAVYDFIKDYVNGTKDTGTKVFDLKNNGVGISYTGGMINDIKSKIDALKQDIISGKIKVPTKPGS